jgi:hypothetical protein
MCLRIPMGLHSKSQSLFFKGMLALRAHMEDIGAETVGAGRACIGKPRGLSAGYRDSPACWHSARICRGGARMARMLMLAPRLAKAPSPLSLTIVPVGMRHVGIRRISALAAG